MHKMTKAALKFFGALLFLWLFVVGYLYFNQRAMVFPADQSVPSDAVRVQYGLEAVSVATADGLKLNGWLMPPEKDQGVIIHFHGNAGTIESRAWFADLMHRSGGYGVLLAEYRGYGGNPGQPAEEGFYEDGRAWISYIRSLYPDRPFVLYGESIGSGPAVHLAKEFDEAGVIVDGGFHSLADIAAARHPYVPARTLLKDRFDNHLKVAQIGSPYLHLHGTDDPVIPYQSGLTLYEAAAQPKTLFTAQGGAHGDLYDFGAATAVLDFLETVMRDKANSNEQ